MRYLAMMNGRETIQVSSRTSIPLGELAFRFSRSGGPGGQHANRSETRVELLFDVGRSPSLTESQRGRIQARLSHLIDQHGVLHLSCDSTRSQHQNREEVIARLERLLRAALRPRKRRRPTRPSRAARERRLEEKQRQSTKKRERRRPIQDER